MSAFDQQQVAEKRRLRTAIARSRRRIDRRVRNSSKATGRLTSWKTYVRRWPASHWSPDSDLGGFWPLACRPRFLVGLFGARLMRDLSSRTTGFVAQELRSFWSDTVPQSNGTDAEGGDDA